MLYLTIGLFALSAILGVYILTTWLSQKDTPKGVIYSHGLGAAIALVLLIIYALQNPAHFPQTSIILFVAAALGGFYLFYSDVIKKKRVMAVAFVHALIAVGGFVTLLLFVFL